MVLVFPVDLGFETRRATSGVPVRDIVAATLRRMGSRRHVWLLTLAVVGLLGCHRNESSPSPSSSSVVATASDASDIDPAELRMPEGSADYRDVLADVLRFDKGKISFEELTARIVARKLPPHRLGCEYLMTPVPMPPPGIKFVPGLMPADWKGTFGEVTMTFWAGKLTREQYDRLHAAAHPSHKGKP